ncbi:MAG: DmsC/YnfH family molybdoenzyme membrane anchor subunit [Adlercreutzia equolifaciens]
MGRAQDEVARRLNRWSCPPLVVTMVGLIASATHPGNPSNALYVFTAQAKPAVHRGVRGGFFALAGVFWLYSFAERPHVGLQRGLLAAIDVAIVAFVVAVAFAYNVDTILTWSLPLVPVSLLLNALLGGPLLALVGFAVASRGLSTTPAAEPSIVHAEPEGTSKVHAEPEGASKVGSAAVHVFPSRCGARVLLALATAACAANVAVYAVLGFQLQCIENELVSAADLVVGYPVYLAAFALLAVCALGLAWRAAAQGARRRSLPHRAAASTLAFTALSRMRFTFT